ncbi:hypothetical protein, partial [Apilactobacillus timberlakei]
AVEVTGYQAQLLGFITNKIFWDTQANALKFPPDYPATDEQKIEMKYKGDMEDIKNDNANLSNQLKDLQNKFKDSQTNNLTKQKQIEGQQTIINFFSKKLNELGANVQDLMNDASKQSNSNNQAENGGNK